MQCHLLLSFTCLFLGHPKRVSLEGDALAPALGGGGVHAQEESRVRREAARQEAAGAAGRDVDDQLVLGVREHLRAGKEGQVLLKSTPASHEYSKASRFCFLCKIINACYSERGRPNNSAR